MARQIEPDRRQFLRVGLAGAVAGGGGCLSTLPPLGQSIRYGRVDVPAPGDPVYREWMPDAEALAEYPGGDSDHLSDILFTTPGNMGTSALGVDFTFSRAVLTTVTDYVGVEYEDYEWGVRYGYVTVFETSEPREKVAKTIARTGYESIDPHRGYDRYARSDVPRAIAVSDSHLLFAGGRDHEPVENVVGRLTARIDAAKGEIPRRHETDDAFDRLSKRFGARPFTWMDVDGLDVGDSRIGATGWTFDDGGSYYLYTNLYHEGETPAEHDVKEELEGEDRAQQAYHTDVEIDDPFVTVEMHEHAEQFRDDAESESTPYVTWGIHHDEQAETLTFEHEAGDSIPTDELRVETNFDDVTDAFSGVGETFEPGENVTFDLTARHVNYYAVIWEPSEGSSSQLLSYSIEPTDGGEGE